MKKLDAHTIRKKNDCSIIKNSTSINQQSFTIPNISSQLQFLARSVIKKYRSMKMLKWTQKNERKLTKVYNSFLNIVYKLLGQVFDSQISQDLIYILNRLVFSYEKQEEYTYQEEDKKTINHIQENQKNIHSYEYSKQIKQSQINTISKIPPQGLMPRINTKEMNFTQVQQKAQKSQQQFRVFLSEKMKIQQSQLILERQQLNTQVLQINNRIEASYSQIQGKIRKIQLNKIIETNKAKLQEKENEKNEKTDPENIDKNERIKCKKLR